MQSDKHDEHPPNFGSPEEEAEFWDSHSPLDYPQHWRETDASPTRRQLSHALAVRLDAETVDELTKLARAKGVGPSTLVRMWIMEHLEIVETERRRRAG